MNDKREAKASASFLPVVAVLCGRLLLSQAPPALLDLAAELAKPWRRPAISGTGGGYSFHGPKHDPKLPLQITLESIEPIPGRQFSLVDMLVQNIGSEPYLLPIGRDPDIALRATNLGRREFWFDLKIAGERYAYLDGQETYGSTDVPSTMMKIPPGGTVRVRFQIDIPWTIRDALAGSRRDGLTEINVQGAVVDSAFDDNPEKYMQHLPFADAFSANELRVPIVLGHATVKTLDK